MTTPQKDAASAATSAPTDEFLRRVEQRFGIVPNFFRSAEAAPGLIEQLWGFAESAYFDNPLPSLFKERLFVHLSRFCHARYCIVRHVGFLLGLGHAAGDSAAEPQSVEEVVALFNVLMQKEGDAAGRTFESTYCK